MNVNGLSYQIKRIATKVDKNLSQRILGHNVVDGFNLPAETLNLYLTKKPPMKIKNFEAALGQVKCRELLGLDNSIRKSAANSAKFFYKAMPIESLEKTSFATRVLGSIFKI